MKKFLILTCIALLSACQSVAVNSYTSTPSKISITPIPSFINTFTSTSTETPIPSETPTPQPTQSFNPASIQTFTPSSPAQCPEENTSLVFDAKKATHFSNSNLNQQQEHNQYIKSVLDYLNSGGTLKSVILGFSQQFGYSFEKIIYEQDATGDNIPELIFTYSRWIDVLGCKDGKYELIFSDTYESDLDGGHIIEITDLNINGLPEIVVYFNGCLGGKCPTVRAYEWNGQEFKDLMAIPCKSIRTPFEIKIQDTDNNGTKEIVFQNNGKHIPSGIPGFPYRSETLICMWNGSAFDVYKSSFDAPYYRFQAVQDGDVETLAGDYQKAMESYQKAISDKNLEWFTQERNRYEYWVYMAELFPPLPPPTVSPEIKSDPNEYPNLVAYAQYRIVLLYVLQNNLSDAQSTFDTLQSKYPFDQPGGQFSKMAFFFWQEYQTSQNIRQACATTIAYAAENPAMLKYLGDSQHGEQLIEYTPEAICPFK